MSDLNISYLCFNSGFLTVALIASNRDKQTEYSAVTGFVLANSFITDLDSFTFQSLQVDFCGIPSAILRVTVTEVNECRAICTSLHNYFAVTLLQS